MILVQVTFDREAVKKAFKNAGLSALPRAGGLIRVIARRSIRRALKSGEPSKEGTPPRSKGSLKNSIRFEVARDGQSVVIGPDSQKVSNVGRAHEFGGKFRGQEFKKRAFMGPALEKALPKLPKLWANTVK